MNTIDTIAGDINKSDIKSAESVLDRKDYWVKIRKVGSKYIKLVRREKAMRMIMGLAKSPDGRLRRLDTQYEAA